MPQHKSAKKRMKTNARDRRRNRSVKAVVRGATQEVRRSLGESDAFKALDRVQSVLDKAAKKGVLHPRTASRRKARLARAVHVASTSS